MSAPTATTYPQLAGPQSAERPQRPDSIVKSALFHSTGPGQGADLSSGEPNFPLPPPHALQPINTPAPAPTAGFAGGGAQPEPPGGAGDPFVDPPMAAELPFLQPMAAVHARIASSQGSNVVQTPQRTVIDAGVPAAGKVRRLA